MKIKELVQIIILLIGLLLVVFAFFIKDVSNSANTISINTVFLSIGCSILAVVIINFFEYQITLPERKTVKTINDWGLISIYKTRADMNIQTNKLLEKSEEVDLSVFGAKGLINYILIHELNVQFQRAYSP